MERLHRERTPAVRGENILPVTLFALPTRFRIMSMSMLVRYTKNSYTFLYQRFSLYAAARS